MKWPKILGGGGGEQGESTANMSPGESAEDVSLRLLKAADPTYNWRLEDAQDYLSKQMENPAMRPSDYVRQLKGHEAILRASKTTRGY